MAPRGLLVVSEKVFVKGEAISAEQWVLQAGQSSAAPRGS